MALGSREFPTLAGSRAMWAKSHIRWLWDFAHIPWFFCLLLIAIAVVSCVYIRTRKSSKDDDGDRL